MRHGSEHECGCGCDGDVDRRQFLTAMGAATGGVVWSAASVTAQQAPAPPAQKQGAQIRCVFLYPPSSSFAADPDGWWSWPGNEFDAENRQRTYMAEFRKMEKQLGARILVDAKPVANAADAQQVAAELKQSTPDGLLVVMFYNRSLGEADLLLQAADELQLPTVFFIGLGVKHGPVTQYRRPGIYFIQSLDNFAAIEYGVRMINTKRRLAQTRLLSITEAPEPREGTEKFFGINVRVIPFAHYEKVFHEVSVNDEAVQLMQQFQAGATESRGITKEALQNAARAHLAIKQLLRDEQADGLTMNCLRRGMLKPCMSFATLNGQLIPAACENDFAAMYGQTIGQLLTGRPGFQHNPCFETEANHYYASHCTCAPLLQGPQSKAESYLLRRFAHTNEGSCAIQVFWPEQEPVTMLHYYSGAPARLDVYAGRVVKSHPMPPAAGCTTNVEIEILDRDDACSVRGHHNVLFLGDHARKFRQFANLMRMEMLDDPVVT